MQVVNDIPATDSFPYYIRHWASDEADPYGHGWKAYKFEIFPVCMTYYDGNKKTRTYPAKIDRTKGEEDDYTDDINLAVPTITAKGWIGRPGVTLTGELEICERELLHIGEMFDKMLTIMWDMCPKITCVNCGIDYYHMMSDLTPPSDQGDKCSTFFTNKWRHFFGSYGSDLYDMDTLEPTPAGVAHWNLLSNDETQLPAHGPYCDTCIKDWVDMGLLAIYPQGKWSEKNSWMRTQTLA